MWCSRPASIVIPIGDALLRTWDASAREVRGAFLHLTDACPERRMGGGWYLHHAGDLESSAGLGSGTEDQAVWKEEW